MPGALAAKAIDAYFVGEPFAAKAEVDGSGRVLYYAKDIWPHFISCVLVVHEDLIKARPAVVRELVRGIAQSGEWAETHRIDAAKVVITIFPSGRKTRSFCTDESARPRELSHAESDRRRDGEDSRHGHQGGNSQQKRSHWGTPRSLVHPVRHKAC